MNAMKKPVAILALSVMMTLPAAPVTAWLQAPAQAGLGESHAFFGGLIKKIGTIPRFCA